MADFYLQIVIVDGRVGRDPSNVAQDGREDFELDRFQVSRPLFDVGSRLMIPENGAPTAVEVIGVTERITMSPAGDSTIGTWTQILAVGNT